jgi:hypothetical protein
MIIRSKVLSRLPAALAVIAFASHLELAQEPDKNEPAGQDDETSESGSQSGYEDIAEFGGPESVGISNLLLSGILDKTGHIPLNGDDLCFESTNCQQAE